MDCIFSVDVEDWFHILDIESSPDMSQWSSLPGRVEENFVKLLDIFSEYNVTVTCFFLGWVAEKHPHLLRRAADLGHEIASHGYSHKLVYQMTPEEFMSDAAMSKDLIENIIGMPVLGYRASGFSVTRATPWFFDKLIDAGYRYDSSVFPARRGHGGLASTNYAPYIVERNGKGIVEFPITVKEVFGRGSCFFGGGYLRLFPYFIVKRMARAVQQEGRPVVFYIHPREIDPHHPRLPMSCKRALKSYVNLKSTESKIRKILVDFKMSTFRGFLNDNSNLLQPEKNSK